MAIFEVQGPDGQTYEIDAPDQQQALSAFQSFTKPQAKEKPTYEKIRLSLLNVCVHGMFFLNSRR